MDITVILCTYNRCQNLAKALESVAASMLPESVKWEVLVVDNNSSDQTRSIVDGFCRRYPERFRYLFEPKQGLSYARNTGIQQARGGILVFVDDDVTVEPTWLQNLTAGLHNGKWVGTGGRILPDWPCAPPSWLPQQEWYGMAPLVMFDLGLEAGPLRDAPFGANMAFHRRMFEKYGNFRTDLGRCGENLLGNEDTEFSRRLLAGGEHLGYEPTAVVRHAVPKNRLCKEYFLMWWFDRGRADIRENGGAAGARWLVLGVPLLLLRKLAVGILRWMITLGASQRFNRRLTVWFLGGKIVESYRQSRQVSLTVERSGAPECAVRTK